MKSYFQSTFLQKLESSIIRHVASDKKFKITDFEGSVHELSEEEMTELKNFFGIANTALIRQEYQQSATSQMIILQKHSDDKFRREIEKTLFKSLYPSSWQLGTLIKTLDIFLKWKDRRQRTIMVHYEPYILRALKSLRERKKKWDERIGWPSKAIEA